MLTLTLKRDKSTPGTVRFKEQTDDRPLTIYLSKERVKELGDPEAIKVTIEAGV